MKKYNEWLRLDRLLIALWADFTIPAREIGERLGVTKNAAIGRAHRLGLAKRQMGWKKRGQQGHFVTAKGEKKPPPKPVEIIPTAKVERKPPLRDARGHFISAKTVEEKLPPRVTRPIEERVKPAEGRLTILDLDSHTCRWPFGDRPPFLYCGKLPFDDSVYCEYHSRVAFTGKAPKHVGRISTMTGGRF